MHVILITKLRVQRARAQFVEREHYYVLGTQRLTDSEPIYVVY